MGARAATTKAAAIAAASGSKVEAAAKIN